MYSCVEFISSWTTFLWLILLIPRINPHHLSLVLLLFETEWAHKVSSASRSCQFSIHVHNTTSYIWEVEFHTDSPDKLWGINVWTCCLPFGHFLTATRTPGGRDYFALWPEPQAGKVLNCHNNLTFPKHYILSIYGSDSNIWSDLLLQNICTSAVFQCLSEVPHPPNLHVHVNIYRDHMVHIILLLLKFISVLNSFRLEPHSSD